MPGPQTLLKHSASHSTSHWQEGRLFLEAPIQARAAAASINGGISLLKARYFFKKKRKGGIEQKMSYQGKKNIPKITVSKELFLLHWLQELWWLLLQITAEGFSVFLRRCDGSLSHTPMQAQSNMKTLFLLSEPTAGSRWNNAHNDMACLATIVTVRQGDKAFS